MFLDSANRLEWIPVVWLSSNGSKIRIPLRTQGQKAKGMNYNNQASICHRFSVFTWWRHQMETFSALLALCAGNSPVTGEFPSQKPVAQSFDIFLICTWTNGWINHRDSGDLRRHRDHYDVTIMEIVAYAILRTEHPIITSTDWKQSQQIKVVGRYFCGIKFSLYFAE